MPSNSPNYATGEIYGPVSQTVGPYQAGQYVSAGDWAQWQQQASKLYQAQGQAAQAVAQAGGSAAQAQAAQAQVGQQVQQQLASTQLVSPPAPTQNPAPTGGVPTMPPSGQPSQPYASTRGSAAAPTSLALNSNLRGAGPTTSDLTGRSTSTDITSRAGTGGGVGQAPASGARTVGGTPVDTSGGAPTSTLPGSSPAPSGTYTPPGNGTYGAIPNYVGGDITQMAQNNRDLAVAEGQPLLNQFGYQYGLQQGNAAGYQSAANEAYDPTTNPFGFTPEQSASISGTPFTAANGYAAMAPQAVQSATGQVYGDINDLSDAGQKAQQSTSAGLAGDVGAYAGLAKGYVDPTALNVSNEFTSDYNFSPQDEQNIIEQAGVNAGQAGQAQSDSIARAAAAAGNSSPLAVAAAEDRARYTGQINASDAMTNASIQAKQLALQTELQKEQTRLGAAQTYANTGLTAAGNVNTAAMNAGEYSGTQEQGILQNQEQELQSAGENLLQQNLGEQGTEAGLSQTAEQQAAARALTEAQQAKTDQSAYRNYLTSEQEAGSQNANVAGQQQLGAYGAQTGAENQATQGAISNYAIPGLWQSLLSGITGAIGRVPPITINTGGGGGIPGPAGAPGSPGAPGAPGTSTGGSGTTYPGTTTYPGSPTTSPGSSTPAPRNPRGTSSSTITYPGLPTEPTGGTGEEPLPPLGPQPTGPYQPYPIEPPEEPGPGEGEGGGGGDDGGYGGVDDGYSTFPASASPTPQYAYTDQPSGGYSTQPSSSSGYGSQPSQPASTNAYGSTSSSQPAHQPQTATSGWTSYMPQKQRTNYVGGGGSSTTNSYV